MGLVYITTPNYNSLTRRLFGNSWNWFHKEHLFYFTDKTLKAFLEKYGFRIKMVRTENIFLMEISKIFKRGKNFDFTKNYEKQEWVRALTEKRPLFSVMKRLANLILNIFGIGDTIYILAVRGEK